MSHDARRPQVWWRARALPAAFLQGQLARATPRANNGAAYGAGGMQSHGSTCAVKGALNLTALLPDEVAAHRAAAVVAPSQHRSDCPHSSSGSPLHHVESQEETRKDGW